MERHSEKVLALTCSTLTALGVKDSDSSTFNDREKVYTYIPLYLIPVDYRADYHLPQST